MARGRAHEALGDVTAAAKSYRRAGAAGDPDGYERVVQGACLVAVQPVRLGPKPLRLRYRLRAG